MRQIDELHVEHPFAGARMLRDMLALKGVAVGRKQVTTLMRRMGIEALYRKPNAIRRQVEPRSPPPAAGYEGQAGQSGLGHGYHLQYAQPA